MYDSPEKVFPEVISYLESPVVANALRVFAPDLFTRSQAVLQAMHAYRIAVPEEPQSTPSGFSSSLGRRTPGVVVWHYLPDIPRFTQLNQKINTASLSKFPTDRPKGDGDGDRIEKKREARKLAWTDTLIADLTGKTKNNPQEFSSALNDITDLMFAVYLLFKDLDAKFAVLKPVFEYIDRVGSYVRWLSPQGSSFLDVSVDTQPENEEEYVLWLTRYLSKFPKIKSLYANDTDILKAQHSLPEDYNQIFPLLLESKKYFVNTETHSDEYIWIQNLAKYFQVILQKDLLRPYVAINPHFFASISQKISDLVSTLPDNLRESECVWNSTFEWDQVIAFMETLSTESSVAKQILNILQEIQAFELENRELIISQKMEIFQEMRDLEEQIKLLKAREAQLESSLLVLFIEESSESQDE